MKGYDDSCRPMLDELETDEVFDGYRATESDRSHRDSPAERARKIARLKAEVNAGSYKPDVKDIARLLTSCMDPTL